MSISELKAEVDRLSAEERRQLGGYLTLKDQIRRGGVLKGPAEQINDRTPGRWSTLEEFEKEVAH